jgi:hypothetical protein
MADTKSTGKSSKAGTKRATKAATDATKSATKAATDATKSATDAAKNVTESTQDALRASLERAQELAKEAAEAGTDVARRIQEALETVVDKATVQSEKSWDAALDAVASLLENAKKVVADSQYADTDTAREIEGAIDRSIAAVRSGIAGEGPEAEKPYEDWTKDELYDRAQTLDIKGRSGMNKKELVKALRKRDAA